MAVNLNAGAFLDQTQNDYAQKAVAEAYMQMYQYAAEDFVSHPDMLKYITDLTVWLASLDTRLHALMEVVANHSHPIPAHAHGGQGSQPVPLTTSLPSSGSAIKWNPTDYPVFLNTTGTVPNLGGNRVSITSASEGSILPQIRRMLPIPITLIPKLSPVLLDAMSPI